MVIGGFRGRLWWIGTKKGNFFDPGPGLEDLRGLPHAHAAVATPGRLLRTHESADEVERAPL
ncbi:hypothetical protein AY599_02505 [Leptolyngbya valderiana BDU 20041]|nr:hypothetical protein AY599_02505 [Leptolyngbya valderiana BDU 20041]